MKKVITYGTFDLFHRGHYRLLERAKTYGDYLIVGVTSENYDIERGKLSVRDSLEKRIDNVRNTGFVDEIIVEEYIGQKIRDIIKYEIEVFVIGSDWIGKFDHLKKYCDVVYIERTKDISSTIIRNNDNNLKLVGMIVNGTHDYGITEEIKYVSGLHLENVLVNEELVGKIFCKRYQINRYCTDIYEFIKDIDIAIIKGKVDYNYIKICLENGIHVVYDIPITTDVSIIKELNRIAKEKNVILLENITILYLRAFIQILWMVESNDLGEIVSLKLVCSHDNVEKYNSFLYLITLSIITSIKLIGIPSTVEKIVDDKNSDEKKYIYFVMERNNQHSSIEVFESYNVNSQMIIVGKNGTITASEDWWNTGYFEFTSGGNSTIVKKYSYNCEGTGFRYILQELSTMLANGRLKNTKLFEEEMVAVTNILSQLEL